MDCEAHRTVLEVRALTLPEPSMTSPVTDAAPAQPALPTVAEQDEAHEELFGEVERQRAGDQHNLNAYRAGNFTSAAR